MTDKLPMPKPTATMERPWWYYAAMGGAAIGTYMIAAYLWKRYKTAQAAKLAAESATPATPASSSNGSTQLRWSGRPPNTSGDPAGYNTSMFKGPTEVRYVINRLGYSVPLDGGALVNSHEVDRFQADWNRVIAAIDTGRIMLPSSAPAAARLTQLRGRLAVDDVPGANTLNAMEIAYANQTDNALSWNDLVKESK